ncbi:hypothetical protein FRC17_008013, partial [Serendipita sp. 399]
YGRGGGNVVKVVEKKYATETSTKLSTAKKILEIEPPRMKMSVSSGRGGGGNHHDHFLEEGVFDRVMEYERGKILAFKNAQAEKRRTRTYSNAKSTKSGSDDGASQLGIPFRRSWASKSTVDVSSSFNSPPTGDIRELRKSLRATLLAPLRTTFTRQSRAEPMRDDTSSFSACSSGDHAPLAFPVGSPGSPVSPLGQRLHSPSSPNTQLSPTFVSSPLSDETYSALPMTPSTAEMFGELGAAAIAARQPVARRQSTGMHRSPRASSKRLTGPPPMPSPTEPLPPLPLPIGSAIITNRSSLPPLPSHPPPSPPTATPMHIHFGKVKSRGSESVVVAPLKTRMTVNIPVRSLQASPAPLQKPASLPIAYSSYSSTASSSQERLKAPDTQYLRLTNLPSPPSTTPPIILTAAHDDGEQDIALATDEFEDGNDNNGSTRVSSRAASRAASRRLYNTSYGARSAGHLPVPGMFVAAREASFYDDGSDVDRVDPFIAEYGRHKNAGETFNESQLEMERSFESLMPWLAPPLNKSTISSLSSISIPSLNDSQPELVAV